MLPLPLSPMREACRAACNSISSSSNPSIAGVAPRVDPEPELDDSERGCPAVDRCGMDDEEREGSGRVEATLSASVRLRASGSFGFDWTIANTEYPVPPYQQLN
jgi:hypothetical protein